MRLECSEIEDPKIKYMGVKKGLFVSPESRGFLIGFVATITASVISLYIFNQYVVPKAAAVAVEKYIQQQQQMSPRIIHRVDKTEIEGWKPLTEIEISNIREVNNA